MGAAKNWLSAFRLRTLPLALSTIGMGSILAAEAGSFEWPVFLLAAVTTLFLQVLSNLANDYGDFISGADSDARIGPERALQSGRISALHMRAAIIIFSLLALVSGIGLIIIALHSMSLGFWLLFFFLGMLCIAAAIKYTVGQKAYGYSGFGDIAVFIFFGLVGVGGTYFLHTKTLTWDILLPSASLGLLSAAVLNLNNMRDRMSDALAGKNTLVVKLGSHAAKIYHTFLVIAPFLFMLIYIALNFFNFLQFAFLLTLPVLLLSLARVWRQKDPTQLDPELKKVALSTMAFTVLYAISLI